MRVGYVQMRPELGRGEENLRRMVQAVEGAPEADLLVCPELALSGYAFRDREEAWACSEAVPDGPATRALVEVARCAGTAVVAGLPEREGEDLYNTAVVVDPTGYVGRYRKAHLFWNEKGIFRAGDELPVFPVQVAGLPAPVPVGVLICFDWCFPEAWRTLALRGAQVVCCPSNLVLPDLAQRAVPVHCLVNRYFGILANRTGAERELRFTGRSLVSGPKGEVLVQAAEAEPSVGLAEIDPARALDKMATPRNHVLEDRRPELYLP